MKKTLLMTAMAGALAMLAQSKRYEGYTLRLEKSPLTETMDTASVEVVKYDYTGSIVKPKQAGLELEQYNYRSGKFEQGYKMSITGAIFDVRGSNYYADSQAIYFPKKDGSLDWQVYDKAYSKFGANKSSVTTETYMDFSYFIEDFYLNMFNYPKGLFLYSTEALTTDGNKVTAVTTKRKGSALSTVEDYEKSDSIVSILAKDGSDSLEYTYNFGDLGSVYLYQESATVKISDGLVATTTTTYEEGGDVTGKTKYVSFSDLSNLIEVDSNYKYDLDLKQWSLQSVDSTIYEADSVSNITKTYEYDVLTEEFGLSAISYTSKGFLFKKGNPIPKAPTDFSVINLLDLLRTSADATPGYKLTWKDESDNEDGFKIYRKVVGSVDAPTLLSQTGPNVTEYTDTDVTEGEEYEYFIAAFREDVAPSPTVSARTDVASAVGDNLILAETVVSPNPVADQVIKVQGISTDVVYSVVNMQGKAVAKGNTSTGVIAANIESGVYVLKLQKNDAVKVLKFEKK